jgi:Holliday junction DNA helicase RuvB
MEMVKPGSGYYLTVLGQLKVRDLRAPLPADYFIPYIPPVVPPEPSNPLEPNTLAEFVGQVNVKDMIAIMIKAATIEHRPLPNLIINGESGLGKTTLSKIILREMGAKYRFTDGATVNKTPLGTISGYFIIDEIHNLDAQVCDSLNVRIDSGLVNIIGCTTELGTLPKPFRSRFRQLSLESYTIEDIQKILLGVITRKEKVHIKDSDLLEVSKRSRFSPRVGISYLSLIFDILAAAGKTTMDVATINQAFSFMGLDEQGLLPRDRQYLAALPSERAVGLQYLTARLSIDANTIEEEIEPFLMKLGLIDRSSRGRSKVGGNHEDAIDSLFGG